MAREKKSRENRETVQAKKIVVKWDNPFFVHKHSVDKVSTKVAKTLQGEMAKPIFSGTECPFCEVPRGEMEKSIFWCTNTAWAKPAQRKA